MKLTIELVPKNLWGRNLRSIVPTEKWDVLRRACYRKAGYVCEVCGGKGDAHPVECHEIWEYNDKSHVQRLAGLIALCPACHGVKHIGRSGVVGKGEEAFAHLGKVNGWRTVRTRDYVAQAFTDWSNRSRHEWQLDLSWLDKLEEA